MKLWTELPCSCTRASALKLNSITVRLAIAADDFVRLYSGAAKDVIAEDQEGRLLRFPGNILRSFVSHEGVCGTFTITYEDGGKFVSIERDSTGH